MKKWLSEELICPECLNRQADENIRLTVEIRQEIDDDITEGRLNCPLCRRGYDINDGIAVIVPEKSLPITRNITGYGSFSMSSSYLWSHYSEFFNDPNGTKAYKKWAEAFKPCKGWALDIGCAVGRLTLEMTKSHDRAVGIDTSLSFIQSARKLMTQRSLEFDLIVEGEITERKSCTLDPGFRFENADFIVADAMALPFRADRFATASSVNILEKVPDPSLHFSEANRGMNKTKARFLFSDPFSWDETVSHPDLWLGGRNKGPFKGFSMDNISRMLREERGLFSPPFSIQETGAVQWKIRKTRNLWEHITSQFLIAQRG
ncbi:MAG: methyltransferase domain-containing protein [Deltaproteobacteria bacterium]|nr:methyltransferase domain-containing protein [Deltaproteobacteria bacterium]